jgi:hypothetical protein
MRGGSEVAPPLRVWIWRRRGQQLLCSRLQEE